MSGRARIAFVVAVAENGVIGRDGKLPWRLPSDLKRFRKLTLGKPVIMGRKTYESIGKPLDGRDNIVVTRQRDFAAAGVHVATSVEEAIDAGPGAGRRSAGPTRSTIIGGEDIFRSALAACRPHLSDPRARHARRRHALRHPRCPGVAGDGPGAHAARLNDEFPADFIVLERQG